MFGSQNLQSVPLSNGSSSQFHKSLTLQAISLALQTSLALYARAYHPPQNHTINLTNQIHSHDNSLRPQNIPNHNFGSQNVKITEEKKVSDAVVMTEKQSYSTKTINKNQVPSQVLKYTSEAQLEKKLTNKTILGTKDSKEVSIKEQQTQLVCLEDKNLQKEKQQFPVSTTAKIPSFYIKKQDIQKMSRNLIRRKVEDWGHFQKVKTKERRQLKKLQ